MASGYMGADYQCFQPRRAIPDVKILPVGDRRDVGSHGPHGHEPWLCPHGRSQSAMSPVEAPFCVVQLLS